MACGAWQAGQGAPTGRHAACGACGCSGSRLDPSGCVCSGVRGIWLQLMAHPEACGCHGWPVLRQMILLGSQPGHFYSVSSSVSPRRGCRGWPIRRQRHSVTCLAPSLLVLRACVDRPRNAFRDIDEGGMMALTEAGAIVRLPSLCLSHRRRFAVSLPCADREWAGQGCWRGG